jgi:riboflavin synthase
LFTGIVERVGTITDIRPVPGGRHLRVDVGEIAAECVLGASICVSGICLTATDIAGSVVAFDVITETLEKSTLGSKRPGGHVNLERSLKANDRLDGHFVQGHVDGRAVVDRVQSSPREHVIWLRPDASLGPYIIPKGSVAVDGVSLTIAAVDGGLFSIALIPTTLEMTTLLRASAGDQVNIETDIIARTVVHWLSKVSDGDGLTIESLREAGFA